MPNVSPEIWSDDNLLRKTFSWLTRIGVAPKFGTLPIAYYQADQIKAIEILEQACYDHACYVHNVRYRNGFIQAKSFAKCNWKNIAKVTFGKLETL